MPLLSVLRTADASLAVLFLRVDSHLFASANANAKNELFVRFSFASELFFALRVRLRNFFRFSFVSDFLNIPGEFVRIFRTSQRSMPFEGQRRWLEASQVSRVVDLERRSRIGNY